MKLFCYESGQGSPLVLIHGMFGDHLDWEPVLEPLSRTHRVIAPDLPGYGCSAKPQSGYSPDLFVRAIEQVCGGTRPILAGNSFGGQVAMLYALAHPDDVGGLVLVDSGGFYVYPEPEKELNRSRLSADALARLQPEQLFRPIVARVTPDVERYLEKQNAKARWPDYGRYLRAQVQSIEVSMDAYLLDREIPAPMLLIWGEKDPVVPLAQAHRALARFPQARLEIIPGAGHMPQLERPEEFLRAVYSFL